MKSVLRIICLLVLIIAFFVALFFDDVQQFVLKKGSEQLIQIAQDRLESGDEDAVSLGLKAIELFQGENGIEIWRLKAQWASMKQQGDSLEMAEPHLTYFLPPDNEELVVIARKGTVNQSAKEIEFQEDVHITFEDTVIKGRLLQYNGTAQHMVFPEGATFTGLQYNGTAQHVLWNLTDNIVYATEGVVADWLISDKQNKAMAK